MTKIEYICNICKEPVPEDFFELIKDDMAQALLKLMNPRYNPESTKQNMARMKQEQLCPACMKKLLIKEIKVFSDELEQEIKEVRERYKDEM